MTSELVGVAEVAALLGVTRTRVGQLSKTPGFPEPLARLAAGPVWDVIDVAAWAERTGRELATESADSPQEPPSRTDP